MIKEKKPQIDTNEREYFFKFFLGFIPRHLGRSRSFFFTHMYLR